MRKILIQFVQLLGVDVLCVKAYPATPLPLSVALNVTVPFPETCTSCGVNTGREKPSLPDSFRSCLHTARTTRIAFFSLREPSEDIHSAIVRLSLDFASLLRIFIPHGLLYGRPRRHNGRSTDFLHRRDYGKKSIPRRY